MERITARKAFFRYPASAGRCSPETSGVLARAGRSLQARVVLWLAVVLAACSLATAQAPLVPIDTVEQVRTLSLDRARAATPVHLSGQVMLFPGWRNSFFFYDGKYGTVVDRDTPYPDLRSGDTVQVDGVTTGGGFAPSVVAKQVVVTGHRPLPPAVRTTVDDLRAGQQDSQWIAIRGVVRSAQASPYLDKDQLILSVDMGGGALISVRLLHYPPNAAALLDGATVRINGVAGSLFNTRRQFIGARLYVNSLADLHIDHPAAADPFTAPPSSLADLLQFNGKTSPTTRVHVQGTVTAIKPGVGFYLQQRDQAVFVETDQQSLVHVGDPIQAIGYPTAASYSPSIANASFRPAPPLPLPAVPSVAAASLLTLTDGYVFVPYDSLLVRVEGTLVESVPGNDEDLLLLNSNGTLIPATLPLRAGQHLSFPRVGSVLSLTGICTAVINDAHEAHGTTLLLRSASDLQVLHPAPWWTGTRAWWLIVALTLLLLAMVGWTTFIRRQSRLHDLIARDPLTSLYNRRGFLLMAERQWNQAIRGNRQMLLFYIDLDRFKQINDTFGHKQGDIALQTVANVLRDCFRKTDVIGRLGGDEFAITALDPDLPEETIRQRINQALGIVNSNQHQPYSLALSLGVLACDQAFCSDAIEHLLARADILMYEQKRAGRLAADSPSATHLAAAGRPSGARAALTRRSGQHAVPLPGPL